MSGVYVGTAVRLLVLLILTASIFYAFFNLGLMVAKNFIIEAYISRWRMEMQSFSMGPPPAWLDDPPEDFLHLPPGSDKYAHFSLSLMIKNNPHWLKVEVFSVQMRAFGSTLTNLFGDGAAVGEDGLLSLAETVPLADVCEGPYLCLRYSPSTELVAFEIYFEAKFTLFGHRSNAFLLATKVTGDAPVGGNYRDDHKLSRQGEMMARPNFGEVIVTEANYRPSLEFIRLDALSSDRLAPLLFNV
ncbi:hypothetical protein FOZ63_011100 [Perkinsus olseni]|uniref:Uncharacterized protein n=1 Tax=Perkinsus olseni TaxID=32597 RepID=A0A7J6T0W7_PEROL|nr:hypothetical protein FOZ63_011100 [Perkinsus olseni]